MRAFCQALIEAEPRLTEYDTIVGDADCGQTLKQGAEAILEALPLSASVSAATATATTPASQFLTQLSQLVEASMGGTSGAIYCIFLDGAASYLTTSSSTSTSNSSTTTKQQDHPLSLPTPPPPTLATVRGSEWISAFSVCAINRSDSLKWWWCLTIMIFKHGVQKIQEYGGAKRGDRTMLDAMLPIVQHLQSAPPSPQLLQEAAKIGMEEALNTASISVAKAGRSSSLAQGSVLGIPDPGNEEHGAFVLAFPRCRWFRDRLPSDGRILGESLGIVVVRISKAIALYLGGIACKIQ